MDSGHSGMFAGAEARRELELKLDLTSRELRRLRRPDALAPLAFGPPVEQALRSIYFDTRDLRLWRAGISLRVRSDGKGWTQTVKCGVGVSNGVSQPVELEVPVNGPTPELSAIADTAMHDRIARLVQDSTLDQVFEVIVQRTARRLHAQNGELELALDDGVVRAGASENPIREAELELISGEAGRLLAAAITIFAGSPLRFSKMSKAERGYRLAFPKLAVRQPAKQASSAELTPEYTCRQAIQSFVGIAQQQIETGRLLVLNSDDPEGAHQLRIGLRRLRSVLRAFRPWLDASETREFDRLAQTLARTVGELRDADILLADIFTSAADRITDDAGRAALKEALHAHRLARRDAARTALTGRTWSTLQLHFAIWPLTLDEIPALDRPVARVSGKVLRKSWKRLARLGRRLRKLTPKQRHDMRKALKQFRYAVEFLKPLYSAKDVRAMTARLKKLQDTFGYLNDVAVARRIESIAAQQRPQDTDCRRAASDVLGWHSARADAVWRQAQAQWQRLRRKHDFFS